MGRKLRNIKDAIVYSPTNTGTLQPREVGGTPMAGVNYLTTDANGNLAWQMPEGGSGTGSAEMIIYAQVIQNDVELAEYYNGLSPINSVAVASGVSVNIAAGQTWSVRLL